jgi:hypothetical protein
LRGIKVDADQSTVLGVSAVDPPVQIRVITRSSRHATATTLLDIEQKNPRTTGKTNQQKYDFPQ